MVENQRLRFGQRVQVVGLEPFALRAQRRQEMRHQPGIEALGQSLIQTVLGGP